MMTSRERVVRALTFANPDRVPRDLWTLPYVPARRGAELERLLQQYPMDIETCPAIYLPGVEAAPSFHPVGVWKDEWGSVWQVAEDGVQGEVKQPALADWSALAHFRPPWELVRRRDLGEMNRRCENSQRFMISECSVRPFERMQFLRGSENLFADIAWGSAEFFKLREIVHEFFLEDLRSWCRTSVDAVMMMDDWGDNRRLLIRPDTWRALFKPLYKEYCDLIHAAGKFAFFHTDGCTEAIYGDLIEVGMDAINSQLFTMDIEELGRRYRGRVTFWGEIDRQYLLPFGSVEEVRAAVRRVRKALAAPGGGVIAQCEWGKPDPYENIAAVFETWLEPA